jgi:hypothetical protein
MSARLGVVDPEVPTLGAHLKFNIPTHPSLALNQIITSTNLHKDI